MRGPVIAGMVGAVIMASAAVAVLSDRTAAQSPFGDPNAEPSPFNPQMGALMSMLIQPRHTKLGLAGNGENWPLAGYMLKELRQGFAVVAKAVPRWKGLPGTTTASRLSHSIIRASARPSTISSMPAPRS